MVIQIVDEDISKKKQQLINSIQERKQRINKEINSWIKKYAVQNKFNNVNINQQHQQMQILNALNEQNIVNLDLFLKLKDNKISELDF